LAFKFNEQQDLAYNVRRAIPEHLEIFQQWRYDADRYQSERPDALMDLEYGPDPRHRLDVFPAIGQEAGESSPLAIVIHGGYWQALDKADNRHVCRSLCDAGWTIALLNYRLCPAVNIGDICDDVEAATHWLVHTATGMEARLHGYRGDWAFCWRTLSGNVGLSNR
jgi:arylformamidase